MTSFADAIRQGIPAELPEPPPAEEDVSHAPRRVADVLLGGGRLGQLGGDPLTDGVGEARHGDGA